MERTESPNNIPNFDLVFIGAGISASYTLLNLLESLSTAERSAPVQIAVIEKMDEFWCGVPYGKISGYNPLLITSLREFIPQEAERSHFKAWLSANKQMLHTSAENSGGVLSSQWVQHNKAQIEANEWDDLFVPRFLFGTYIQQYLETEIASAQEAGMAVVTRINGTVLKISGSQEAGFRLGGESGPDQSEFSVAASKIVLSIGSPPNIGFKGVDPNHSQYVTDVYEIGLDKSLQKIKDGLAQIENVKNRNLVFVGSNASTLDVLYALNNHPEISSLVSSYTVLSPNGAFPHRITGNAPLHNYVPTRLQSMLSTDHNKAADILTAIEGDVAECLQNGINISDVFPIISKVMIHVVDRLSYDEQYLFVIKYAVEIGKLQRRAGSEYLNVVGQLVDQGKLKYVKGRFTGIETNAAGELLCKYIPTAENGEQVLSQSPGVVVCCAGFQTVSNSRSVLINNLVADGLARVNDSNRGFVMTEAYEVSPGIYQMGPLVAGNLVGSFRVWHAESCSRIIQMSKSLGKILAMQLHDSQMVSPGN